MRGSENNIVVGLQWGKEGKGRIIDLLSLRSDTIVRFQGCSNGGRLIEDGPVLCPVNYLPAGIQISGKKCLITSEVTLDLEKLSEEIQKLKALSLLRADLMISPKCNLILSCHKIFDVLDGRKIGHKNNRTLEEPGYGHCGADRLRRLSITAGDLLCKKSLSEKLKQMLSVKNEYLTKVYAEKEINCDEFLEMCLKQGEVLLPYIKDPCPVIADSAKKNTGVLFECCGGALNDIEMGIYPNVMPTRTSSAAAFLDTGFSLRSGYTIIGVAKAYSVRTDAGPFITEITGSVAAFIRNRGKEFHHIDRSPARIGWLDMPAIKHAAEKNFADVIVLTNLDVLTGVDEINICTSYIVDGKERTDFNLTIDEAERAKPIYKTFHGWREELSLFGSIETMPIQAQIFIRFIEEYTGRTVIYASAGLELESALFKLDRRG